MMAGVSFKSWISGMRIWIFSRMAGSAASMRRFFRMSSLLCAVQYLWTSSSMAFMSYRMVVTLSFFARCSSASLSAKPDVSRQTRTPSFAARSMSSSANCACIITSPPEIVMPPPVRS